jgi:hypothetical protein
VNDDLKLLAELGRAPLPRAGDLTAPRARLTAAIHRDTVDGLTTAATAAGAATTATGAAAGATATGAATVATAGNGRRRAAWWRRPLVTAGVATGVAAAVAAAIVFAPSSTPSRTPQEPPGALPSGASSSPSPGDRPTGATPAAMEVLRRAAVAAIAQPFVEPRPDQFLYVESLEPGGGTRRDWLSIDGTRDSLIGVTAGEPGSQWPGCVDGQRTQPRQGDPAWGTVTEPCDPEPTYLPDAPTDAAAMVAYLEAMGGHPGPNSMAKNILFLMSGHYLRPQARAAVFEAAATIPGLDIVPETTDGAGRPGVGVGWTYTTRSVMVFDPVTYAFLGFEGGTSQVAMTIVDAAGQLP